MTLCTKRPEGFGPLSHLYSHILTSCFLDTILVPLCTWLYLTALVALAVTGTRTATSVLGPSSRPFGGSHFRSSKSTEDVEINKLETGDQTRQHRKIHTALSTLYYLLVLAQILMCILEIVRLSLAQLGIGLLPFTFVTLIVAAALRFTKGMRGRIYGWKYLNLAAWIALAVTNGVKVAEERKEGTDARKGSKYPVEDEMTDVSVMIGVYAVLAFLEGSLRI
ncbi:MAG: hypothetical protein ALECFALPRED_004498 [Alectoria fallacina]|uniref:Uncharacterized protein n=1 Tax=Alectoria fallacina TaxID=1903189 RepID=A0A8H3FRW3_9LECA|nr:MAG: hypothetical protein ALECFALPRED_004498 [Alectoria fallacina]